MKPYGLMSDSHNHAWSAFASTTAEGINSRLKMLLDETARCAQEVRKAGGDTIIHAGDLFHVRGSLAPSVLNPTKDAYRELIKAGFKIVILAGNHDLEGKEALRISSAITALEDVGCKVINSFEAGLREVERVVLIPWTPDLNKLKDRIIEARDADPKPSEVDLVLHAPIDGVISGLPDHGLDPAWLATLGFRHVFSGHYHHHKTFAGNVHSIGAIAHHTWSDVGSKAGFLVVDDAGPKWFKSHAPEFIEITALTDPSEIPLIVDGNYVRAKINSSKAKDINDLRSYLESCGSKGVVILSQKEASVTKRDGSTVAAGASIEVSVGSYVKASGFSNEAKLTALCQDILTEARAS